MSVQAEAFARGYLLCLLCAPVHSVVLVHVSVSSYPLERGQSRHRLRPYPQVMLYAEMGTLGRARRGLSWIGRELADLWTARDGWVEVPADQGRAFRRLLFTAAHRYGTIEAKKAIHHVDLAANSMQRAARNYRRVKPRSPLSPIVTQQVDV